MFAQNVGGFDRIARIVLGLVLIVVGFFLLSGVWGIIVGVVGLILLLTGLVGWCPLYLPFKFSSRKA